jgi:hypothetical protein
MFKCFLRNTATCKCVKKERKKKKTAQIATSVRARVFNTGLLASSQFASGRSCDRPIRSRFPRFSLVTEQMLSWHPKFHVPHAALQMATNKRSPNVALLMLD